jgi:predicted ATPase
LLPIGQFQQSKQHFEESIALSKTADQQSLYSRYMVEPNTASLLLLSWDLWILGFPRQSLSRVMEALTLARELDHPYSVAFSHYMISVVHLLRGEPAEALSNAEASLEVSREQRFSLYALLSRISRGYALSGLGRPEEAKTEIRLGLDDMRSKGVGFMLPMMESWLADVLAQSGDNDAALSLVERSLVGLNDVTGRSWESELHLRKAQLLLALGPHRAREAQATLMKAIDVARLQGARSFELRAVASLASLLSSQGKNDEARSWLEPVYGWFAEGHDTQDLRHARDVHLAISSSDTVG